MLPRRIRRSISSLVVLAMLAVCVLPTVSVVAQPPVASPVSLTNWLERIWAELEKTLGIDNAPLPDPTDLLCDEGPGLDPSGNPCNDAFADPTKRSGKAEKRSTPDSLEALKI